MKAEVPASYIAELKKLRLEQNKIREDILDVDRLGEMICVEKEASPRKRINNKGKGFENNLKLGENQVMEASGYAETVLNVLRDNYIPKYTMVTLVLILIMMMYHVVFDDNFSTVQSLRTGEWPPFWEELVRDNTEHFGIVDPATVIYIFIIDMIIVVSTHLAVEE